MKKTLKATICMLLVAALCFMSTGFVFASQTSNELSLDDLLNLLSSLTGDEDTDDNMDTDVTEVPEADGTTEYVMGDVTFRAPSDWTAEEEEGGFLYLNPDDFSVYVSCMYAEDLGETIDLHDQVNIDAFITPLGGEDAVQKLTYVNVCGYDSMWVEASVEEGAAAAMTYSLLVPMDDTLFMLSVASMDGGLDEFVTMVNSIAIEGGSDETDLSAALDGAAAPADDTQESKAPAGASIDATAAEEVVLVDDDVCKVTMKNFGPDDYHPFTAKIYTENKTDLNLYFTFDDFSVNGYMCDPWWGTSVAAKHKNNSNMTFYSDDFDASQITDVKELEFTLHVRDDDDYSAPYLEEQTFVVYPFGEDAPDPAPVTLPDDALVVVDNDDITMVITGFGQDDYYFFADVYLENNTDTELEFSASGDSAMNGYELSPYFYKEVMPGKKMFTTMTWSLSTLEENDIDNVEDIELDLEVQDANDWSADPIYEDVVYITME